MVRRAMVAAGVAGVVALLPASSASAATKPVYAGGDNARAAPRGFEPNAFFRKTVTIHVGDSVRWLFRGFHTVTFAGRGATLPAFIVPGAPVSGQLDAAGVPFWFNGQTGLAINRTAALRVGAKTFNGAGLRNSGLPVGPTPKPYVLRFTKAGEYTYHCLVHPGMKAKVKVVGRSRRVPSLAADARKARSQLAAVVLAARQAVKRPPVSATTVQLGRVGPRFSVNRMFPSTLTVKAGTVVTFSMLGQTPYEIHTVTFGPGPVRSQLEQSFVGGPPAFALNPVGSFPSDPPPTLPPYTGTNHANGFLNAGILDNLKATKTTPPTAKITFTVPGTYNYECIVHAHMDGTIVVT